MRQIKRERVKSDEPTRTKSRVKGYTFSDLVDVEAVRELMESFYRATGFVVGVVDVDGTILVQIGYRDICTKFHRVHGESEKRCIESDLRIARQLERGTYSYYTCANGLIDAASPILIDGEHLATIFTGQFFFDRPEREFFVSQAKQFGFDEDRYLAALDEVPVVTHEQYDAVMSYLTKFAILLGELGLKNKREREVQKALRNAHKMEAIGRLAGGIAHDFNNLLQGIIGYTELAKLDVTPNPKRATKSLNYVYEASQRAQALVRQLLAFSRRDEILPVSLNPKELAEKLIALLMRIIGERIELSLRTDEEVDFIYADPNQIEQILMNLCVNARDAIDDHGRIEVLIRNAHLDGDFCVDFPQISPGDFVAIDVTDDGCGIPQEVVDHIFEPFFTTKEQGKGTGLGLSTVYGIAKRHRGFVTVSSRIGSGTTVSVYFPATAPPKDLRSSIDEIHETAGGTETILVAEDDEIVRNLVVEILTAKDYTVHVANDGAEAINLFEKYKDEIDMLLLDVLMPNKNGRQVYEYVNERRPNMPVLFCSGYSGELLEEEYRLNLESARLIFKPYQPRMLLKEIRALLSQN